MLLKILCTKDDYHLRNHGLLFDGAGWLLSPLYDVVPKPQVGLERRLVLGVGPEGRNATIGNALAGAAVFDLGTDEAAAMIKELRMMVAARWQPLFKEAGLSPSDQGRFASCFRLASEEARKRVV